jgi:hypothetical protein
MPHGGFRNEAAGFFATKTPAFTTQDGNSRKLTDIRLSRIAHPRLTVGFALDDAGAGDEKERVAAAKMDGIRAKCREQGSSKVYAGRVDPQDIHLRRP